VRRWCLLVLTWIVACASAPGVAGGPAAQPQPGDPDRFAAVDALLQGALPAWGGGVLRVEQNGQLLFERAYGGYKSSDAVPIAAGTRLISTVLLLSLVREGILSLDAPVRTVLPSWPADKRAITLRMLLAQTSGLPARSPCLDDRATSLPACVQQIAATPLRQEPGTGFIYGGTSLQVAGRMAELATGKSWEEIFRTRLADPLQLKATGWGPTTNPRIAGGAQTTAAEYSRVLRQLLPGADPALLSEPLREEILADQTRGLPLVQTPFQLAPGREGLRAGLGVFRERIAPDGRALEVLCQGMFGFTGWVDRERDLTGVLLVHGKLEQVWPVEEKLRALVRAAVPPVTR
jgi:CubicO group peptidase (beta-lactamase class C family)